jgi:hypothetical protein
MGYMKKEEEKEIKSELEMAREFRELAQKRGITDVENYWDYLHSQKMQKFNASEKRMLEADQEMKVLEKMLRGEL